MGIVSITATAVVSTMVQRYFATPASWTPASAPPAVQPGLSAEPVSDAMPLESPLLTNQAETNQAEINQPDQSAEMGQSTNSPIQVETQPVPDSASSSYNQAASQTTESSELSASEPPASEPSSGAALREKLDSALRDKWRKQ